MFLIEILPVGPIECNAIVLGHRSSRDAVIIDPGDEAQRILAVVRQHDLKVHWLLHTHGHFDHVGATRTLKETLQAPIALHQADQQLYQQSSKFAAMFGVDAPPALPVDHFLTDGEVIPCGAFALKVLHTPGHTPGGVCFFLASHVPPILFAGDTLFHGSVGRTDLPGGDFDAMENSIRKQIYTLTDETKVICGHGSSTTVGREKHHNKFVKA